MQRLPFTVVWDVLKGFARPVLRGSLNEAELLVDLIGGSRISLYGGDNPDRLAEGRITDLPPEPGVPVHTAWDIGHRHSTAIWFFQVVGPEVHVIDFYENHEQYADHYCGVVSARAYQ